MLLNTIDSYRCRALVFQRGCKRLDKTRRAPCSPKLEHPNLRVDRRQVVDRRQERPQNYPLNKE